MDLRELLGLTKYDADKGSGGASNPKGDDLDGKGADGTGDDLGDKGGQNGAGTGGEPGKKGEEPKTFTQEELDQIIADRLVREKKKRDDAVKAAEKEAERIRLEDQNDYKTLYEKALLETEQAKQVALGIKKSALLTQAGYSTEQAELLVKLVEGDDDEAIADSINLLKATVPAQDGYADPSAFNGVKDKPGIIDNEEVGRNAVSRVLHKIKL